MVEVFAVLEIEAVGGGDGLGVKAVTVIEAEWDEGEDGIFADDFLTSSIHISSSEDGMSTLTRASLFNSLLTSVLNQLPQAIRRLFLYRYSPCSS